MRFQTLFRRFSLPIGGSLLVLTWLAAAGAARAETVTLNPAQDTFISDRSEIPNGTGLDMVIGTQGMNANFAKNRGLIQFDLSSIPSGATIISVKLRLAVKMAAPGPSSNFHLHRLLQPWDDLESTWSLRLEPDENWGTPGGQEGADYSDVSSASVLVAGVGAYTFTSTSQLVSDVTAWLANPAANYGWLVKTEDESVGFTARRFHSREGISDVPALEVQFDGPAPSLRISSAGIAAGEFCLGFTAQAGKTYTLERREQVDSGEWAIVATRPPSDSAAEATLCDPLALEGNRFYRVGEQ